MSALSENNLLLSKETIREWEIEAIGTFLVEIYHRNLYSLRSGLFIKKSILQYEFMKYLKNPENKENFQKLHTLRCDKIGTLLHRTNFLRHTERGSGVFCIKDVTFYQYRNKFITKRFFGCGGKITTKELKDVNAAENNEMPEEAILDPALLDSFQVSDTATVYELEFQGASIKNRNIDFIVTNMGCFVCQRNFISCMEYQQHLLWHGQESTFESLKEMAKSIQYLKLSYRECTNSHYFRFSMDTSFKDIVIEKIIIMEANNVMYINNDKVPFLLSDVTRNFFVDSNYFTIYTEQPIVVVFYEKSNITKRIAEQHHFLRSIEFPKVHFSVKGKQIPCRSVFKPRWRLPAYLPNEKIRLASKNEYVLADLCHMSKQFDEYIHYNNEFNINNMVEVLKILVAIEDIDTMAKYRNIIQTQVNFERNGKEYSFQIKMDMENVLSITDQALIILEDKVEEEQKKIIKEVYLKGENEVEVFSVLKGKLKKNYYIGNVENVFKGKVNILLKVGVLDDTKRYTVVFRSLRMSIRYQYAALDNLQGMKNTEKVRILFPNPIMNGEDNSIATSSFNYFHASIKENTEQSQAVHNIVTRRNIPAPYIVFGPPGTGKTTTIVESILQLYSGYPRSKILVTASSNSACNEVALRLCPFLKAFDDPYAIARIFAKSYDKKGPIDDDLLEVSNMYGMHFYPSIEVLHEYRIVICTISVVGKLQSGNFGINGFGEGVFTHVFVDEVAAATEAEVLVAITSAVKSNTDLIISGDHKQLGPILQSKRAKELGLDVSLLDRLIKRECYKVDEKGNYNTSIYTRLIRNYRSHPAIVDIFNDLYYDNELISVANFENVSTGVNWHLSPNPKFPIIFHSVFGLCANAPKSVSFSNTKEIDEVMNYVRDLIYYGVNGKPIKQSDIGIISPYKKQYLHIQQQLNLHKLFDVETGSVETFQGKEKDIIIVSFVRSFTAGVGFLDNPRRLNVTLSRAKSLMILIGNPRTLSCHLEYKRIIDECHNRGTMVGSPFYDDYQEQKLITKFGELKICTNLNSSQKKCNNNRNAIKDELPDGATKNNQKEHDKQYYENRTKKTMKNKVNNGNTLETTSGRMNVSMEKKINDIFGPLPPVPQPTTSGSGRMNITMEKKINDIFGSLPSVPKPNTRTEIHPLIATSAVENPNSSDLVTQKNNSTVTSPPTTTTMSKENISNYNTMRLNTGETTITKEEIPVRPKYLQPPPMMMETLSTPNRFTDWTQEQEKRRQQQLELLRQQQQKEQARVRQQQLMLLQQQQLQRQQLQQLQSPPNLPSMCQEEKEPKKKSTCSIQ